MFPIMIWYDIILYDMILLYMLLLYYIMLYEIMLYEIMLYEIMLYLIVLYHITNIMHSNAFFDTCIYNPIPVYAAYCLIELPSIRASKMIRPNSTHRCSGAKNLRTNCWVTKPVRLYSAKLGICVHSISSANVSSASRQHCWECIVKDGFTHCDTDTFTH